MKKFASQFVSKSPLIKLNKKIVSSGSKISPLPTLIFNKKCILNPQNNFDEKCFMWCYYLKLINDKSNSL